MAQKTMTAQEFFDNYKDSLFTIATNGDLDPTAAVVQFIRETEESIADIDILGVLELVAEADIINK